MRQSTIAAHTHIHAHLLSLAKVISERWKSLSAESREFYHQVARADRERYNALVAEAQRDTMS
jgi:HMG (high mobility group) box